MRSNVYNQTFTREELTALGVPPEAFDGPRSLASIADAINSEAVAPALAEAMSRAEDTSHLEVFPG